MATTNQLLNIEQLVDKHFDEMFGWLCSPDNYLGDNFYDIVVEVKVANEGKTIRRSYREREKMLREEEHE